MLKRFRYLLLLVNLKVVKEKVDLGGACQHLLNSAHNLYLMYVIKTKQKLMGIL